MNFLALKNDIQTGVAHAESLWFASDVRRPLSLSPPWKGGIAWPPHPKPGLLPAGRRDPSSAAGQELPGHKTVDQNL